MDSHTKTNRGLWDGWAALHARSAFYDLAGFRDGKSSLKPTERAEVGPVEGKRLLHLQCHLGLDTLSWARLGAEVTGVDFSENAVAEARSLAADCGLPARFVCQDVLELDLGERFDIVFASYGVLCWIRDKRRWAEVVARHLVPGGSFYLIEFHPVVSTFEEDGTPLRHPYFASDVPVLFPQKGSYGAPDADFEHDSYEWPHSIADIVTPLVEAGLRIELLHEFPFSSYGCFPFLEEEAADRWVVRGAEVALPLMFSVKAAAPPAP